MDEITSGKITINTSGAIVGQANALTVVEVGNYEFGTPLRVTCQIGCGKGEIIDVEREAEQSGPFHSKGRLIIRGLMSNLFGKTIAFAFHATLCMEQTYSEIDGDSASLAEACTLLSSLSDIPLKQCYAITGAIDQMGNVQAVGGINQKIEGFYRVCQARNSNATYGVIIPSQNVEDIMLNEEVIEAVAKGNFSIISVDSIIDAMEILTGTSWNKEQHSLNARCLATLRHFNRLRDTYRTHHSSLFSTNTQSTTSHEIAEAAFPEKI